MKKTATVFSLIFALILSVSATGCGKDEDVLYYLNFKPESAEIYAELARDYKKETGVTLNVVTAAANSYEATLKSELAKKNPPTIFHVNGPVGYESWSGYCEDITDYEITSHLSDKSGAISKGGKIYAVPYVTEGYGIIYNEEILDRYFALDGKATDFESVEDINGFDKLFALADDMSKHLDELGIDGVFASTSMQSGEEWRWQTHLFNLPLYYELSDRGLSALPQSLDTLEFSYADEYKNVFDLYTTYSATDKKLLGSKTVADSMAEFALGKCAMVQNGNWAWSQISGVKGNVVKESDIGMLPIYIGAEGEDTQGLCIGTENYLAINSRASDKEKQLANDFLIWLFTSDTGKEYITEKLGFIVPYDTFDENDAPDDPLAKEVYRYLSDSEKNNIPWSFTVIPSLEFKNSLAANLLAYAQGSLDFEKLTENAKAVWEKEAK